MHVAYAGENAPSSVAVNLIGTVNAPDDAVPLTVTGPEKSTTAAVPPIWSVPEKVSSATAVADVPVADTSTLRVPSVTSPFNTVRSNVTSPKPLADRSALLMLPPYSDVPCH